MAPNASQWSVVHLMVCSCEIGKRCVFDVCTVIPGSSKKLSVSFICSAAILTTFARDRLLPAFLSTSTTEKAKAMPATQKLSANWHPLPYLSRSALYWAIPASLANSVPLGSLSERVEIMPTTGAELLMFPITALHVD